LIAFIKHEHYFSTFCVYSQEERMRKEKSASKGGAGSKSSATRDELSNGGERRASVDRENVPPSSGRGKGNRDGDDDGSGAAAFNSQSPQKVKKSGSFSSAKDTTDGGKQSPPVYDDSTARGMTAATSLGNLSGRKGSAILPTPMKPLPLEGWFCLCSPCVLMCSKSC
jgi:hypothetical protein